MSNWLSRMFTIPRKKREELNDNPLVHLLALEMRSLAISSAQATIDDHISDPMAAEAAKVAVQQGIEAAIPIQAPSAAEPDPTDPTVPSFDRVPSSDRAPALRASPPVGLRLVSPPAPPAPPVPPLPVAPAGPQIGGS